MKSTDEKTSQIWLSNLGCQIWNIGEKTQYLFLSFKNFQNKKFKMLCSLDRGGKCNFFNGTCFLANEDYFCDWLLVI